MNKTNDESQEAGEHVKQAIPWQFKFIGMKHSLFCNHAVTAATEMKQSCIEVWHCRFKTPDFSRVLLPKMHLICWNGAIRTFKQAKMGYITCWNISISASQQTKMGYTTCWKCKYDDSNSEKRNKMDPIKWTRRKIILTGFL